MSRLLDSPRALPAALALGLILALPALGVGLVNDDLLHRAALAGIIEDYQRGPTELYDFMGTEIIPEARERGLLPWWTNDDLSVRFFRPTSSALLALDATLFGRASLPAHAHSVLWFLALLLVVGLLYRRVLPRRSASAAIFVYAVAGAHGIPLAWLAARHVVVTAVFGLVALLLHLRARQDGWWPGRLLSPLALAVALTAGESALGSAALILFFELLRRDEPLVVRLRAVAPTVLLVAGYLLLYLAAGYGSHGSGAYVNPLANPVDFLAAATTRVPALVAETLGALPSVLYTGVPEARIALALLGVLAILTTVVVLRAAWHRLDPRERSALPWLLAGCLAALLPVSAAVIGGRLLTVALVGGSALVGVLLVRLWGLAAESGALRRRLLQAFVVVMLLAHFVLGPTVRVGTAIVLAGLSEEQWRIGREAQVACLGEVVLVNGADPSINHYAFVAAALSGAEVPRTVRVLLIAPQALRIEDVDETGFELLVVGERRPNEWERVVTDRLPRAGDRVELDGFRADVLESTELGPTRVRFDFGRPLDSADLCFVQWRGGRIRPLPAPRSGQVVLLPYELGPMGI